MTKQTPEPAQEEVQEERIEVREEHEGQRGVHKKTKEWTPKTSLGKAVLNAEITSVDQLLDRGVRVLEAEIIEKLMPEAESELLLIGQSKGKFGGGAKRIFRQTQKKTPEGNKPSFACISVIGDKNGHVGIGFGKSKDTVPAREKAARKAKLNVFKIARGCGSWQCGCKTPHSIPFTVVGKCGSSEIHLIPAPKGKGLCVEKECAKILKLAGIQDCWGRSFGQTRVKSNLIEACIKALKQLTLTKIQPESAKKTGLVEGSI